jgi:hypothetical protein
MKIKYLIRIIALTLAGYGLYILVSSWRFIFALWVYKQILKGDLFCITGFVGSIFYLLMVVSAYLLYMFKKKGRAFSLVILITQLSLTFMGLIRFWWLVICPPELPPELQSIDLNSEMTVSYSIYPVYFIGFMCIVFIICLAHKKVAREYNRLTKRIN